jgi:hypothetical protein
VVRQRVERREISGIHRSKMVRWLLSVPRCSYCPETHLRRAASRRERIRTEFGQEIPTRFSEFERPGSATNYQDFDDAGIPKTALEFPGREPRLITTLQGNAWEVAPNGMIVMVRESDALQGDRPDVRLVLNLD